jgi:beta-lactamase regulating signal transducer with metallopeptidase domain
MFEAIGKASLHSLWHGAVVSMILYPILKKTAGEQRKIICHMTAMIVLLFLFFSSFLSELPGKDSSTVQQFILQSQALADSIENETVQPGMISRINKPLRFHIPYNLLGTFWIIGVSVMIVRLIYIYSVSWYFINKRSTPLPESFKRFFFKIASDLSLENISLKLHEKILSPCVAGIFRTTVILPLSVILSEDEELVKAILVHELMHIKNKDQIISFLSKVIQALLFFNPFIWWMGKELENEQECRTDRESHEYLGDKTGYAENMVKWARIMRIQTLPFPAFSKTENGFTSRIKRILQMKQATKLSTGRLAAFLLLLTAGIFLSCIGIQQGISALQQLQNLEEIESTEQDLGLAFRDTKLKFSISADPADSNAPISATVYYKQDSSSWLFDGVLLTMDSEGNFSGEYTDIGHSFEVFIVDPRWSPYASGLLASESSEVLVETHLSNKMEKTITIVDDLDKPVGELEISFTYKDKLTNKIIPAVVSETTNQSGQFNLFLDDNYLLEVKIIAAGYKFHTLLLDPVESSKIRLERAEIKRVQLLDGNAVPLANIDYSIISPSYRWESFLQGTSDNNGWIEYTQWRDDLILDTNSGSARLQADQIILETRELSGRIRISDTIVLEDLEYRFSYDWKGINDQFTYFQGGGQLNVRNIDSDLYEFSINLPFPVTNFAINYKNEQLRKLPVSSEGFIDNSLGQPLQPKLGNLIEYVCFFETPDEFPAAQGMIEVYSNYKSYLIEIEDEGTPISFPENISMVELVRVDIPGYFIQENQIDLPKNSSKLTIQLIPAGTIAGSIRLPDGSIPEHSHIRLYIDDETQTNTSQYYYSRNGSYIFHSLDPSKNYVLDWSRTLGKKRDKTVRFRGDQFLKNIDLVLDEEKEIEIQVFQGERIQPTDWEVKYSLNEIEGGSISSHGTDLISFSFVPGNRPDELYIELLIEDEVHTVDLLQYDLSKDIIRINLDT